MIAEVASLRAANREHAAETHCHVVFGQAVLVGNNFARLTLCHKWAYGMNLHVLNCSQLGHVEPVDDGTLRVEGLLGKRIGRWRRHPS